jgi:hypothetical protein
MQPRLLPLSFSVIAISLQQQWRCSLSSGASFVGGVWLGKRTSELRTTLTAETTNNNNGNDNMCFTRDPSGLESLAPPDSFQSLMVGERGLKPSIARSLEASWAFFCLERWIGKGVNSEFLMAV